VKDKSFTRNFVPVAQSLQVMKKGMVISMKISTKGRYALRLMLDLALNNTGEYISIKSIASRQDISEKYLEQIISLLNRAGYVKSIRGAQGGYRLSKDPKEYTVGMLLRLTEGSLMPVDCLDLNIDDCDRVNACVTREVWQKLYDAILGVVDHITLQDLVDKQLKLIPYDFSI
jgi:Rrf2 family protein